MVRAEENGRPICLHRWTARSIASSVKSARIKTRLEKRLRQGAFEKSAAHAAELEEPFEVVRHKRFEVEAMTVEEAILQMNLLDHHFFFFKNADAGDNYAVLYKRASGGYGLIEGD